MNISELGEFGLIDRFSKQFISGLDPNVVGIGDDCAVIPQESKHSHLVTTDMLVEDIHFLKKAISPMDLGHKSLAVNLSDIAAMGGKPLYAFLSLGLPSTMTTSWVDSFFSGFGALAGEYGVKLLGGDTTRSPGPIIVNVAIVGEIQNDRVKLRSSAQTGDVICVTNYLGDSGAGLRAILENQTLEADIQHLITQHHKPSPHVKQGQWLTERREVNAMIDISDGVNSDIKRIMEKSSCGSIIHLDHLPISPTLYKVSTKTGWELYELAASGGEDYCLLLTVDSQSYEHLAQDYKKEFRTPLYQIGEITNQAGLLTYMKAGVRYPFETKSDFEHFPKSSQQSIK